jgi:hypothetical protein
MATVAGRMHVDGLIRGRRPILRCVDRIADL